MCGTLELGRMDVYLGDFYAADLDSGAITQEDALALMICLWDLIIEQFREVDGRIIIGGRGRPNEATPTSSPTWRWRPCACRHGRANLPQLTLRSTRA